MALDVNVFYMCAEISVEKKKSNVIHEKPTLCVWNGSEGGVERGV